MASICRSILNSSLNHTFYRPFYNHRPNYYAIYFQNQYICIMHSYHQQERRLRLISNNLQHSQYIFHSHQQPNSLLVRFDRHNCNQDNSLGHIFYRLFYNLRTIQHTTYSFHQCNRILRSGHQKRHKLRQILHNLKRTQYIFHLHQQPNSLLVRFDRHNCNQDNSLGHIFYRLFYNLRTIQHTTYSFHQYNRIMSNDHQQQLQRIYLLKLNILLHRSNNFHIHQLLNSYLLKVYIYYYSLNNSQRRILYKLFYNHQTIWCTIYFQHQHIRILHNDHQHIQNQLKFYFFQNLHL